jgi:hypothetical protein
MIQSVAGGLRNGGLSRERPFRDPHHSASLATLVGGGPRARPEEIRNYVADAPIRREEERQPSAILATRPIVSRVHAAGVEILKAPWR